MTIRIFCMVTISALLLSACANTRAGISKDSETFGDKVQRTSEIWTQ